LIRFFLEFLAYCSISAFAALFVGCECSGQCHIDIDPESVYRKCEFADTRFCTTSFPGCVVREGCWPVLCLDIKVKSACESYSYCLWHDDKTRPYCDTSQNLPDCGAPTEIGVDAGMCPENPECVYGVFCSGKPKPCERLNKSECESAQDCYWESDKYVAP
jgi:hypothetical protein